MQARTTLLALIEYGRLLLLLLTCMGCLRFAKLSRVRSRECSNVKWAEDTDIANAGEIVYDTGIGSFCEGASCVRT